MINWLKSWRYFFMSTERILDELAERRERRERMKALALENQALNRREPRR